MTAADRARAALDVIRDGEHERSDAEQRVAAFVEAWKGDRATFGDASLTRADLRALLGQIDELRRFPPVVLTGQLPTHRRGDRSTSERAGTNPDRVRRAGSQALRLLEAYHRVDLLAPNTDAAAHPAGRGLIDSEARAVAELSARSCYWKRCSELRADGLIEPVLEPLAVAETMIVTVPGPNRTERVVARVAAGSRDVTRPDPDTGEERIVCRITELGRRELAKVHAP